MLILDDVQWCGTAGPVQSSQCWVPCFHCLLRTSRYLSVVVFVLGVFIFTQNNLLRLWFLINVLDSNCSWCTGHCKNKRADFHQTLRIVLGTWKHSFHNTCSYKFQLVSDFSIIAGGGIWRSSHLLHVALWMCLCLHTSNRSQEQCDRSPLPYSNQNLTSPSVLCLLSVLLRHRHGASDGKGTLSPLSHLHPRGYGSRTTESRHKNTIELWHRE